MGKNLKWILLALVVCLIGFSVTAFSLFQFYKGVFVHAAPESFRVQFGVLGSRGGENDYYMAQETTTLPLKLKDTGFRYGLVITSPDGGHFTYRYVFHFSSAPKIISSDTFQSDKPSDTLKSPVVEADGSSLEYFWFDPGDPVGAQSLDVYINEKLVKTISYTVVP